MNRETHLYGDNADLVKAIRDAGRTLVERADEIGGAAALTAELDVVIKLRPEEVPDITWTKRIMPYSYPERQEQAPETFSSEPLTAEEPEYTVED